MAGNHRSRCCNVPSHPFSFGVLPEKKVTGILAIGLESQESDMYAGGIRTRDPINGSKICALTCTHCVERDDNLLPLQRWWEM